MSEDSTPLLSPEELADLLAPMEKDPETFTVTVQVGRRTLTRHELEELQPGRILEIEQTATDQVELYINDHCIGRGEPVSSGEKTAVRLTQIDIPPGLLADHNE